MEGRVDGNLGLTGTGIILTPTPSVLTLLIRLGFGGGLALGSCGAGREELRGEDAVSFSLET